MTSKPAHGVRSRSLSRQLASRVLERLDPGRYPIQAAPRGRWLIRTGDLPSVLPYIEAGRLDAVLQLSDQGGQVIPVTFGAGEIALLSTLFGPDDAHNAGVVAAEPARLRWLPRAVVEEVLLADKELLVLLVRFLSQRLREVRIRERGWLERGVSGRVRAVLARVALEVAPVEGDPWLIAATHEHLALRCGVSRPKLSFELKQLETAGILKLNRGTFEILDYKALLGDE